MTKKAAIVGAGIGGMATAVRLASKGFEVSVFEANDYPGGKLSSFETNGYRFDAGPSLFTMPHLVDELFLEANKNPRDYFQYQQLEKGCFYFWEDGTHLQALKKVEDFAVEVEKKLGVPKKLVLAHFKKSAFIYKNTYKIFLENSLHKIQSYLNFSTFKSILNLPFIGISKTMHEANKNRFSEHKKMVQLFDRFATYNGSNPYSAPATLNIIPHLEHHFGAYFPKGGMISITNCVFELAKTLGVKFHFGKKVNQILTENSIAKGIEVNNEKLQFDYVISNMDIVPTYKYLLKHEKQPTKVLNQERSSSALIFYWGIKKEFPQLDLHNLFFSENYSVEFKHIFEKQNIFNDPTVYVNISSKFNKNDAPKGCENWFVMINVPGNFNQNWEKLIEEARQNILIKLSRILKVDLKTYIETETILDPILIEQKTSSFRGSLYGTSSNNRFAAFFRHPNFSKNIKKLYFVGGSVHPGGGIPLALSSAKITADLILKD